VDARDVDAGDVDTNGHGREKGESVHRKHVVYIVDSKHDVVNSRARDVDTLGVRGLRSTVGVASIVNKVSIGAYYGCGA